jgi:hypothetical protein
MSNPLIPRQTVHAWSETIADQLADHQASLQRLLSDQRRLTRFIEANNKHMGPGTVSVCVYMTGVIARMFDLAGGRLRGATWAQVHEAEAKVKQHLDALLPLDEGFVERFHAIPGRAQAHILDEAAMALFEAERTEEEAEIDKAESFKVLLVCWVVTEVLDANWRPAANFSGEDSYTYVHIEPRPRNASPA